MVTLRVGFPAKLMSTPPLRATCILFGEAIRKLSEKLSLQINPKVCPSGNGRTRSFGKTSGSLLFPWEPEH